MKGVVFVNDHNLGRYWNVGPQETLYLPGVWLDKGLNKVGILVDSPFFLQTLFPSLFPLLSSCFSASEMLDQEVGEGGYFSYSILPLPLLSNKSTFTPPPPSNCIPPHPSNPATPYSPICLQGRPHSTALVSHRLSFSKRRCQAPWYSLLMSPTWAGTSMLTEQQPQQPLLWLTASFLLLLQEKSS